MSAIVEASIILRCVNRASREFEKVGTDAKTLEDRLKGIGRGIAGIGALTIAAGSLAGAFGLVNPQVERVIHAIGAVEVAMGILSKTEIFATIVTWAYNASLTVKVALLTAGIGVVIAMAVAMWALSEQAKAASKSMKEFGESSSQIQSTYGVRHSSGAASRRGMER